MLVSSHERGPLARLLAILAEGERLAQWCASSQSTLVGEPRISRVLQRQARQEQAHARLAEGALAWLAPRHGESLLRNSSLHGYRIQLQEDLRHRAVYTSILAGQVLLEGVGSASYLCRVLLQQEAEHTGFGHRVLYRALKEGQIPLESLETRAYEYLAILDAVLADLGELLEALGEEPAEYRSALRLALPPWLGQ